ncbi:MAG: serine/threonine-protein kinase [Planctomycetota bacterium]
MLQGLLDGRFQIEERIASGSNGELYRALDQTNGAPVAIKVIKPGAQESNESLARRLQEFRLLKNLSHPNAVQVIQSGLTDNNVFYVAMEFLQGRTLSQIVSDGGPISPERLAGILDQLAAVLDAAHQAGIIHRGIKPKNIVIHTDEQGKDAVKLMGFVAAKVQAADAGGPEKLTQAGTTVGTPAYMSPEQAMGRRVTKLSDVYSVGVTLYAALTGALPFDEKNDVKTLVAHVKMPVPPFRQKNPSISIPAGVEAVVQQALAKEPAHRPMSMGDLARMFREAVEHPDRMPRGLREIPVPPTGSHPVVDPKTPATGDSMSLWYVAAAVATAIAVGVLAAVMAARG